MGQARALTKPKWLWSQVAVHCPFVLPLLLLLLLPLLLLLLLLMLLPLPKRPVEVEQRRHSS